SLTQVFAGLEVRHVFTRQRHGFAGLGITTLAWRTKMQREAPETTNLDASALRERIAHDFQHLLHGQFHVFGRQMFLLGCNELDEFRFGHARARCCSSAELTATDMAALSTPPCC